MSEARWFGVAGLGHLLLLLLLSLSLQRLPEPRPADAVIAVDLVELGPEATTPAARTEPPPPRPLPPAPEARATPEPAEPGPPLPAPALSGPPPAPAARDTSVLDAVVREPAPAPRRFDAGALENLIDRALPRESRAPGPEARAAGATPGRADPRALATLEAAIRAQIAPCWNPPIGGQDVKDMTVVLRIRLNRDGSVAAPPEFVSQTGATEANAAYARAFVETARRAVLRCAPLDLPQELYAQWREFELNFDPRLLT